MGKRRLDSQRMADEKRPRKTGTGVVPDPADVEQDLIRKRATEGDVDHQQDALESVKDMILIPNSSFKEMFRRQDVDQHQPSASELEELDHSIVKASYQIEELLSKFQWLKSLDLDQLAQDTNQDPMVRSIVSRPRIRIAAMLVKQYWNDSLAIFDDILYVRHGPNFRMLPQVNRGELTTARLDELQAIMLQAGIDAIKQLRQRISGDDVVLQRTQNVVHDLKKAVKNKSKNSSHKNAQSIDQSAVEESTPQWPPPLPEISNVDLVNQVFTHKSTIMHAALNSRTDLMHSHNERLEFKGDSILDFFICDILFTRFPNDSEGSLSMKKASLVCNDTLFDLSVSYRLHERLQVSSQLREQIFGNNTNGLPDATRKNKAIADVFEAYIAGVAMDKGLFVVQKWLQKLYEPLIADIGSVNGEDEVDKNAKNELYRKVGSALQPIQYVTNDNEKPFTVRCLIQGEEVATGTADSKKEAGLIAAANALRKTELVEKYAARRRGFPRTAPISGTN